MADMKPKEKDLRQDIYDFSTIVRKRKDILNLLDQARHLLAELESETDERRMDISHPPAVLVKISKPLDRMYWEICRAEGFCRSAQDRLTEIKFPRQEDV